MTATRTPHPPAISAWSAVSPFGIGREPFAAGLRSGRPALAPLDPAWQAPEPAAFLVPEFDVRAVLGRKGTRSMDRATGLAVTAVGRLLDGAHGDERTALVLGTSTGSAQSIMDFTRDSLTGDKPYDVDPARFPNTVMNCAAGQCAIWHRLEGPNATIAAGRASGLSALQYSVRLLAAGHAGAVLCGAVEEFSHARAWLEHRTGRRRVAPRGEGCAVLRVEPDPAGGLAQVLGLSFVVCPRPAQRWARLGAVVARTLRRAGVDPAEVALVSGSGMPEESGYVAELLPGSAAPESIRVADAIGDTAAAAAAFQLCAVLARAADRPGSSGRCALVTAIDHDGVIGCALLRLR